MKVIKYPQVSIISPSNQLVGTGVSVILTQTINVFGREPDVLTTPEVFSWEVQSINFRNLFNLTSPQTMGETKGDKVVVIGGKVYLVLEKKELLDIMFLMGEVK